MNDTVATSMSFSTRLRVDPIRCDAYGHCAELLPELIELDEWGYPIITDGDVPEHLRGDAIRAVDACPRLALRLERHERPIPAAPRRAGCPRRES